MGWRAPTGRRARRRFGFREGVPPHERGRSPRRAMVPSPRLPAVDHGHPGHDHERGPLGGRDAPARTGSDPRRGWGHDRVGDVSIRDPDLLAIAQVPPTAGPLLRHGGVSELLAHGRRGARHPRLRDARRGRHARASGAGVALDRARRPVDPRPPARAVAGRLLLQDVHPPAVAVVGGGPDHPAVGRVGPLAGWSGRVARGPASPLRRARHRGRVVGPGGRRIGGRRRRARGALRRGRGGGSPGGDRRPRPARGDRRLRRTDGGARLAGRPRAGASPADRGGDGRHRGAPGLPRQRPARGDARAGGRGPRGKRHHARPSGGRRRGSRGGSRASGGASGRGRAHRRGRRPAVPRGTGPRRHPNAGGGGGAPGGREGPRSVRRPPRRRRRDPWDRVRPVRPVGRAVAAGRPLPDGRRRRGRAGG